MSGRFLLFPTLLGFVVFLLLPGCGQDTPSGVKPSPPKKVKVSPKPLVENADPALEDKAAAVSQYVYDPADLRDPFEPLLMIKKPVLDDGEPLTPLQKFDLSQFRLSAIVVGKKVPTAMVVAPGGKAYVIKPGVKIGKNGGIVKQISADTVVVEEKYYDFTGKLSTTNQEIRFTQKAGDN